MVPRRLGRLWRTRFRTSWPARKLVLAAHIDAFLRYGQGRGGWHFWQGMLIQERLARFAAVGGGTPWPLRCPDPDCATCALCKRTSAWQPHPHFELCRVMNRDVCVPAGQSSIGDICACIHGL